MANYFAMPAETLEKWLVDNKFERTVQYREVVYVRKSQKNPDVVIKVYTSIRDGASNVRNSGRDAIRVCSVFDNGRKSFGIGKFPPVFRVTSVESVLGRLKDRIMDAAKRANEWIEKNESTRSVQPSASQQSFSYRKVEPMVLEDGWKDSEELPLFLGE
jgi:hypothetical protein